MSRRLYFMLPDVDSSRRLIDELKADGLTERHIHAISGTRVSLQDLPKASELQKSEFSHGIEAGLSVGGVAGLLGGLLAVTFPPAGLILGGEALLAGALAGAGFGALVSGLVARDIPNHELEAFQAGLDRGKVLLLVDVPRNRVKRYMGLITDHHPEVEIGIAKSPKG